MERNYAFSTKIPSTKIVFQNLLFRIILKYIVSEKYFIYIKIPSKTAKYKPLRVKLTVSAFKLLNA